MDYVSWNDKYEVTVNICQFFPFEHIISIKKMMQLSETGDGLHFRFRWNSISWPLIVIESMSVPQNAVGFQN